MSAEPAEPPAGSPARRGTAWLWWALALLPPVPWLVGLAARWHWFAELFTHFRFQWLLGAGGVGVLLLIARKWRPLALCGLAALILGSPLLGSAASSRALRSGNWEGDLTVCTANVLTRNRRSGELIEAIKERAPDVLCLQEIDARWAEDLMALHATYPYREVVPRQDNFGIAVYSKLPATFETVDLEGVPMMKAVVDLREERDAAARELTVFNVHTLPPVGRSNAARRNRQMADVAQRVRAE
ncbi:MAG: endonuclease/exonuclease/phosphatase family protein, partial [Planctomycetota bacterium]